MTKKTKYKYVIGQRVWFVPPFSDILETAELPEILTGIVTHHGSAVLYEITCKNGDLYDWYEDDLFSSYDAAEMAIEESLLSDVQEDIEELQSLRAEIKQVHHSLQQRRVRLQAWYKAHPQHCQRG